MINFEKLKEKPFYLSDEDIVWVKNTLGNMTDTEKVGQLFFLIGYSNDHEYLNHISCDLQVGDMMYRVMRAEDVIGAVSFLQQKSKIPMLISANLEAGGNGIVKEGTKIGSQMAIAATDDSHYAYELGSNQAPVDFPRTWGVENE